ncbi:uncharacterized protein LOC142225168 [Haematobia irritans]|uniref:uncharacterized protein LOC142225168 n=1 Tax=Haematobia irritans TaxID=7368 RepID=UPI003F4F789A
MKFLIFVIFLMLVLSSYHNTVLGIYCPCNLRFWDPVCATNGITYVNRCEFECTERAYAILGRRIFVIRKGPCNIPTISPLLDMLKNEKKNNNDINNNEINVKNN